MKKIFALATLVFTIFVVTGCGGSSSGINMDVDLSNKPELKFLGQNADFDPQTDSTALLIEEITGYKVNYNQLPATSPEVQLNLQLSSKTPYHAITVTRDQYNDLVSKGALLELDGLIDKYGTNMKEAIQQDSWDVVKFDGKIYGIPERSSSDNINWTIALRQDWLDELDLDMPETKEEFQAVLQAFKDNYGANDPAFAPLTFDANHDVIRVISSAFGVYTEWQEVDGELKHQLELPGMADYVDYMGNLAKANLIDKAVLTNDGAAAMAKFTSGKAGAIVTAWWSAPGLVAGLEASNQKGSELSYMQPLKDEDGNRHNFRESGFRYVTVIPKYMGEEAAYAIDWMDKKLEKDNFRQIVLGEEGKHFIIDVDGNYLLGPDAAEKNNAYYFLNGTRELDYAKYWQARVRKNDDLYECWYELNKNADEIGVYNPIQFAPALEVYAENLKKLATLQKDNLLVMMYTDKSSANYDSFLNNWKSQGGQDSVKEVSDWYKNN